MALSFAKSVNGATKSKLAAPKSKYIEHILVATHTGEAGVAEVIRALQSRLRDSTWTVVLKSLIVVHFMIREGQSDVTLAYLSHLPRRKLAVSNFAEVHYHGRHIRAYSEYLLQRALSYELTKVDYVRNGEGRLKSLTVDKGLLRETECIQDQIRALLYCDLLFAEPENEIITTAFRLLTMDLLALFQIMNEGTINVLEHYLEMSKPDAERALRIYKIFTKQTDQVVRYLALARQLEYATRLQIPQIKHAPTSLANSLQKHLNDKDFELNRRNFLARREAERNKSTGCNTKLSSTNSSTSPGQYATTTKPQAAIPSTTPDLMDFFESIDQYQQPMVQGLLIQPTSAPGSVQQPIATWPVSVPSHQLHCSIPVNLNPQPSISTSTIAGGLHTRQMGTGFYTGQMPLTQPITTICPQTTQIYNFPNKPLTGSSNLMPAMSNFHDQMVRTSNLNSLTGGVPSWSNVGSLAPQSTNPFRKSILPSTNTVNNSTEILPATPMVNQVTGSNPFTRPVTVTKPISYHHTFPDLKMGVHCSSVTSANMNTPASTNPFSRNTNLSFSLLDQSNLTTTSTNTGTNPFRKSKFATTNTINQGGIQTSVDGQTLMQSSPFPQFTDDNVKQISPDTVDATGFNVKRNQGVGGANNSTFY